MTEKLFLKQLSQLPEDMKKELFDFFEYLLNKYQDKLQPKRQSQESGASEESTPHKKNPPGSGKKLPIVKFQRTGPPVPLEFGGGKHLVKYMADDFTAPLEDFKDYM
ncbi:MAG: DUF2281 domain-containing protein [Saprospiraceae bacterium]